MTPEDSFGGMVLMDLLMCLSLLLLLEVVSVIALVLELRWRRRSGQESQPGSMKPAVDALLQKAVPITAAAALPTPRIKLFLSWAAVQRAVRSGTVSEEDLDQCLFCTSIGELSLAEEYDNHWFERLHPVFAKAARESRLICNNNQEHYNRTPLRIVDIMLERHGHPRLLYRDESATLEQIPLYASVPCVEGGSPEVLWAAHPLRGHWQRCWGRSIEAIDQIFASMDEAPEEDCGRGGDNAFWTPDESVHYRPIDCGEQPNEGVNRGGEEEDPADFWKKGRSPYEQ